MMILLIFMFADHDNDNEMRRGYEFTVIGAKFSLTSL